MPPRKLNRRMERRERLQDAEEALRLSSTREDYRAALEKTIEESSAVFTMKSASSVLCPGMETFARTSGVVPAKVPWTPLAAPE